MKIRFSIIVPSIGRPTLCRTIQSVIDGGFSKEDDELIVISDGPNPEVRRMVQSFKDSIGISDMEGPKTSCWGNTQRMIAMKTAKGTHIAFIDDDDGYFPGALTRVREAVSKNPDRPHIFKMQGQPPRYSGGSLWRSRDLIPGNVGTPMIVTPNVPEKLGVWGENGLGDYEFINSTSLFYGKDHSGVVWVDDVIVHIH